MAKTPKTEDQRSEKEAAELRDAALKRALGMPHRPHAPGEKLTPEEIEDLRRDKKKVGEAARGAFAKKAPRS